MNEEQIKRTLLHMGQYGEDGLPEWEVDEAITWYINHLISANMEVNPRYCKTLGELIDEARTFLNLDAKGGDDNDRRREEKAVADGA